jgi:hypothetical protein
VSTPSGHQPPDPGQPSTREIPVVPPSAAAPPLPPHPQAASPVEAAQPTGPVDFVPGLPAAGAPPPPSVPPVPPSAPATAPAPQPTGTPGWPDSLDADERPSARQKVRVPVGRATLVGLGLAVLAVVLLEIGLLLTFSSVSYWSAVPLWSAFATLVTVVALVAVAAGSVPARSGTARPVAIGAVVALAVFWVLVVVPNVASDRGFVLTAALACLAAAVWAGTRRTV